MKQLQEEFIRLDRDNTGVLTLEDIKRISESEFGKQYSKKNKVDWQQIIEECDLDGDGQIDFQDFVAACLDRKALVQKGNLKQAFQIIDTNKDGEVTL